MRDRAVRTWDGVVSRLRHRLRESPGTDLAEPLAWVTHPMGAAVDVDDQEALLTVIDVEDPGPPGR